jgi:hypothetical protein
MYFRNNIINNLDVSISDHTNDEEQIMTTTTAVPASSSVFSVKSKSKSDNPILLRNNHNVNVDDMKHPTSLKRDRRHRHHHGHGKGDDGSQDDEDGVDDVLGILARSDETYYDIQSSIRSNRSSQRSLQHSRSLLSQEECTTEYPTGKERPAIQTCPFLPECIHLNDPCMDHRYDCAIMTITKYYPPSCDELKHGANIGLIIRLMDFAKQRSGSQTTQLVRRFTL